MEKLKVPLDSNQIKEYKICLLGSGGVGKTSLAKQFVEKTFNDKYDPTIEDLYQKTIEIDGKEYSVEILDTAGTDTFLSMRHLYISNSNGFLIVYSITSEGTFNELHQIYNQIRNIKKEKAAIIVVGNKIDLSSSERVVNREKGQSLADQWMASFYETSAKQSINVDQIFVDLIRQMDSQYPYVRRASKQEDMPLTIIDPIKKYFCCPFFTTKKAKKNKFKFTIIGFFDIL